MVRVTWLLILLLIAFQSAAITRISLSADDITTESVSVKKLTAEMSLHDPSGDLRLTIGEFISGGRRLTGTALTCRRFVVAPSGLSCNDGNVTQSGEIIPLTFNIADTDTFDLSLLPSNERWIVRSARTGNERRGAIDIQNGAVKRFAALVAVDAPKPSKGSVTGRIEFTTEPNDDAKVSGRLSVKDVDFSDAAGLHAGEKIAGSVEFNARRSRQQWRFKTTVDWPGGEVLWQPVYLAAAHKTMRVSGTWNSAFVEIDNADIEVASIGKVSLNGRWKHTPGTIISLDVSSQELDLEPFFSTFVKPFATGTALAAINATGKADVKFQMRGGVVQSAIVRLHDSSFVDGNNRYKIEHLRADLPWVNGAKGEGVISFDAASICDLPIGPVSAKLQFAADNVTLSEVKLPVLDGAIKIDNLQARRVGDRWVGEFSGAVEPISLPKLTTALRWPKMDGVLEGYIPKVRFDGENVIIDGALQFKVFDGYVVATNMRLGDALGAAPQLEGTVVMSNLDLDVLTKTFSFGKIKGRIDAALENMLLSNWKPVRFDGRVISSDGDYPRKISQQAVQNISSLGGAGAAAAIQRSFLRIFEQFGYKKIGLTCKLRNTVCEMGGVANTPQGYVLVQGGGIPSITVMGYNRQVGWEELLARIKAATQSNVGPVVK